MKPQNKPRNRKVKGFYVMVIVTVVVAALKVEFTWPLTMLILGLYGLFAGLINADDAIMAWIQKGGKTNVQMVGEGRPMDIPSSGDSDRSFRAENYD